MSNRIALALVGMLIALFFFLWMRDELHIQQGTVSSTPAYTSSGSTHTGTLLVSPYGVEDDLIDIISEAKYSVDMWMYTLTSTEMVAVFKNLALLGVDIDIILENAVHGGSSKDFDAVVDKLVPLGVEVLSDEEMGTNYVHAKTLLMDGSTYIISTANLGYSGFWRNREYRFIGSDPAIAKNIEELFEKDKAGKDLSKNDIHPALLVCPIDCRKKITDLLWTANERIDIQAQYVADKDVVAALKKKMNDGVEVRMIVGKHQDEGRLEAFGTGVKTMDEYYMHAKNILIDDEYLIMGSMNFSTNGLDNNREVGIIIDDRGLIDQFDKQFQRDREKAKQ